MQRDPLNFVAHFEDYMLHRDDQSVTGGSLEQELREIMREEQQSYMELAADYGRFGLYEEAAAVLDLFIKHHGESDKINPMLPFYLGYYQEKIGDTRSARKNVEWGTQLPHSFVFPHRVESEKVLQHVLKLFPRCGKAAYYLGNLLCVKGREQEVIKLWGRQ